jgi:hypothetical protein
MNEETTRKYHLLVIEMLILITQLLLWGKNKKMKPILAFQQDKLFSVAQEIKALINAK